jgi:hypothetical protein
MVVVLAVVHIQSRISVLVGDQVEVRSLISMSYNLVVGLQEPGISL